MPASKVTYYHCYVCSFSLLHYIGNHGSTHQKPSLPSSESLPEGEGQQKYNTNDGDVNTDTKPAKVSEENEGNQNIFEGDVQEQPQTETATAKSQQNKLQHSDHHGIVYS